MSAYDNSLPAEEMAEASSRFSMDLLRDASLTRAENGFVFKTFGRHRIATTPDELADIVREWAEAHVATPNSESTS